MRRACLLLLLGSWFTAGPALAQATAPDPARDPKVGQPPVLWQVQPLPAPALEPPAAPALPTPKAQPPAAAVTPPPVPEPEPCTVDRLPPYAGEGGNLPDQVRRTYERRRQDMVSMDVNCDGILSAEEREKGVKDRFTTADKNKDGVISEEEASGMVDAFRESAIDTHGALTDRKAGRLENKLKAMDADRDGRISDSEYNKYYKQRYEKLDKNQDGNLGLREYRPDVEKRKKKHRNDDEE